MSEQDANTPAAANEQDERKFVIEKIYLKDSSLESPMSPEIFLGPWNPTVDMDLATSHRQLGDDLFEVIVTATVKGSRDDGAAFLVEVQQGCLFRMAGFSEEERGPLLGSYVPGLIFPYVREAVADFTGKAGFPPLMLQPVNFDAFYMEQQKQGEQAQA